jgi:NADH:ubiquinone oxidoreductase subunit 5 (subunit L)/multisubunit Na+/H+ antiporter MnhA subunit
MGVAIAVALVGLSLGFLFNRKKRVAEKAVEPRGLHGFVFHQLGLEAVFAWGVVKPYRFLSSCLLKGVEPYLLQGVFLYPARGVEASARLLSEAHRGEVQRGLLWFAWAVVLLLGLGISFFYVRP